MEEATGGLEVKQQRCHGCGMGSIPGLETSIHCGHGLKKKKRLLELPMGLKGLRAQRCLWEDVGLIPGLDQWVRIGVRCRCGSDPVLPRLWQRLWQRLRLELQLAASSLGVRGGA